MNLDDRALSLLALQMIALTLAVGITQRIDRGVNAALNLAAGEARGDRIAD